MADFKKHISRNLQSARQWLTRAEESFDHNRDIRGELDLLLAQAELQRAREANRNRQWRYKYSFIRHGLAFGIAVTVAAGFGGAYWWLNDRNAAAPIPLAPAASSPAAVRAEQAGIVKPGAGEHPHERGGAPVQTIIREPSETKQATMTVNPVKSQPEGRKDQTSGKSVEPEPLVTQDEMYRLIRAAGQTLRHQ